uniref:Annexin n=1 Tax=Heterorhabditis bacteriophora TaxID=37862 RepID=A0A1I7WR57_HETBA
MLKVFFFTYFYLNKKFEWYVSKVINEFYKFTFYFQGLGTKESVLIEIMTSRTNQQIVNISAVYKQLYNKDLERDLIGETSGSFKYIMLYLYHIYKDIILLLYIKDILYKNSLENMIKGDCSGSYKDGLIALVVGNVRPSYVILLRNKICTSNL